MPEFWAPVRSSGVAAVILSAAVFPGGMCSYAQRCAESRRVQNVTVSLPKRWRVPAFHVETPARLVLPNGMVALLEPDHGSQMVTVKAWIRGGARDEGDAEHGIALLYSAALSSKLGNASLRSEFNDYLSSHGVVVTAESDPDKITVEASGLALDAAQILTSVARLITDGSLDDSSVAAARTQLRARLQQQASNLELLSIREAIEFGYGGPNAYGRSPDGATLERISAEDLRTWYSRYIHPGNTIIGISGDFDVVETEHLLCKTFEKWLPGNPYSPPTSSALHTATGIYTIDRAHAVQVIVRIASLGTTRDDSDYPALLVLNKIMSEGRSSRLVKTLRSGGLSYDVGGSIGANFGYPGLLFYGFSTRPEKVSESIRDVLLAIEEVANGMFTEPEFSNAKQAAINSYIFEFDSPDKMLTSALNEEFYKVKPSLSVAVFSDLQRVKLEDVKRVAKRFLSQKQFAYVVAGDQSKIDLAFLRQQRGPANVGSSSATPSQKTAGGSR